jgi:hypothetical protein
MGLKSMVLAVAALMLAARTPTPALACGMPLGARIPSEQALIKFANGRQEIITSVHLQSDEPGAAVIFPVPGEPEVSALTSNDLFTYLEDVTRPEVRIVEQAVEPERGIPAGAAPGGVNVLGREVIGGYDVARLQADDAGALQEWLGMNGYRMPDRAEPILKAYVDEDWKFVAIKLAPSQTTDGALMPLRMAFNSETIVYPMRLGALADRPVDVLLYVLAEHRVEIPRMRTLYAGPVALLDKVPPADLAPLFSAPYLTKLRNSDLAPGALTEDFVVKRAANDEPYREVETRISYVVGTPTGAAQSSAAAMSPGAIIGIILVVLSSAVALGIAVGLRRRINQIAGPDPDKEDD